MVSERLLQYIWESASFDVRNLRTIQGQALQVIQRGSWNRNQGPDFLLATIRIDGTILVGNIEMHLKSSDWFRHAHERDAQYKNVILHVVWEHDEKAPDIPVLEMKERVASILLGHYEKLMRQPETIACARLLHKVTPEVWREWKEKLLHRRMMSKANLVCMLLQQNNSDWEEVNWWMLARAFGLPVNRDAFENVARSIPLKVLIRESFHPLRGEALLMGQAGMLEGNFSDEYPRSLQKEFRFLEKKYRLKRPALQMKLLRMRPAAFPGIRLSQLASLVPMQQRLLPRFCAAETLEELKKILACSASSYWDTHYRFDEASGNASKKMGAQLFELIVLNAVAPMVFAFGVVHRKKELLQRVGKWLWELGPETNNRVSAWNKLGVGASNAADTQALLELTNEYCAPRKCLECGIAQSLLLMEEDTWGEETYIEEPPP